ncbi:MAG: LptA/OstA family protein [Candidatus Acidiferrales bacterium]
MRNREAARYARWSAMAAGLIVLVVACVYVYRAVQRAKARREMPAAVPASVERRSAQFTYKSVDQGRTLFILRASEATQYKDHDRALLENVWITLYGRDGRQNDNIHTRECSFDQQSGGARCQGAVQIDIGDANSSPDRIGEQRGGPSANPSDSPSLHLVTSDLSFNRDTGDASTAAPVEFTFPGGSGSGMGVDYNTHSATIRLERAIRFQLAASDKTGGLPVTATGSSLEIHRNDRTAVLNGPVSVQQGARSLSAQKISIQFDAANRAKQVVVEGNPQIHAIENGSIIAISASQFQGQLNPAGWIERVTADGNVRAARQTKAGGGHFAAEHVEFAMVPGRNLVQDMTATGGVTAESQQSGKLYTLRTEALRVAFSAPDSKGRTKEIKGAPSQIGQERVESAETLAPAKIELTKGGETTTVSAKTFVAQTGTNGRIEKLFGHSGVTIRRVVAGSAAQTISSAELAATLDASGDWETVEESGGVHMREGDRKATARSARIDRATEAINLEGSPMVMDGASRTSARQMAFNQKSGALDATGEVVSTYVPSGAQDAVSLGAGAAHISADSLTGSAKSGHVTYAGHVRLWQGESVLQADRIDLWQDGKKMQASGNVVAVFPQSAGPSIPNFATPGQKAVKASGPTLWKIRAPLLTYFGGQGRAHLQGGVVASSDQGTLRSRTLDVYLGPGSAVQAAPEPVNLKDARRGQRSGVTDFGSGRQLGRVIARGDVVVEQGLRRGVAQQAEYTASDGKFVLSGGSPTVTDGSSNSATGGSLTFYVASDTILIDSQEGSRTLSKHKVEK